MPELPEVETTCNGIRQALLQRKVTLVHIRQAKLRWPIQVDLKEILQNQTIWSVERRAKYILIKMDHGTLIMHLGMSGKLSLSPITQVALKHDHFDLGLDNGNLLRFNDPRRFGAILWTDANPLQHRLLINLGPEPLTRTFNAIYLHKALAKGQRLIKDLIMDQKIVVGVGNIYATEALYHAGIRPTRIGQSLSFADCENLVREIKIILRYAIKKGGTSLKDFLSPDGEKGYFKLKLLCYGKRNTSCLRCNSEFIDLKISQRMSVYCPLCQK